MIFRIRLLGIIAVLVALALSLHQIIRYPIVGWQWEQMLQLGHHESTALILISVAVLLFYCSFKFRGRKTKNKKGQNGDALTKEEVMKRCQRVKEIYLREY